MIRRYRIKADYKNWIPDKIIKIMGIATLLSGLVTIISWIKGPKILSGYFGLIFLGLLYGTWIFKRAQKAFSDEGGQVMDHVLNYVLSKVPDGEYQKILDIGCGSGKLTIKAKKKFPKAQVYGLDYWGESWEYSKKLCQKNAKAEGVETIFFQKGDAVKLNFEDGYFDVVLSNFVFHEVKSVKDKKALIQEGLRVVKKGGYFVFHDLFFQEKHYGEKEELLNFLNSMDLTEYHLEETTDLEFFPSAVKHPILLKRIGILYGKK